MIDIEPVGIEVHASRFKRDGRIHLGEIMAQLSIVLPTMLVTLVLITVGTCDECGCGKKSQAQALAAVDTVQQPAGSALAAH